MENKNPQIFIIGGKSRHGKDTFASMIKNECEKKGKLVINLQYSYYIKEYAKKISDWNGNDETKPRELLQILGTDIIRKNIDENFFIKRIHDDIRVYSYFFDIITISDARYKIEIDKLKQEFSNANSIKIIRPNFDNGLTETELMHQSEINLDDYDKFDYYINNNETLEVLKENAHNFVEKVVIK